ncbi:MAG: PAS domain-containing protein [Elusimicrobia bacterium]|nr:PAS domain-containing protein [Elusimicrobiota bacterium]
MTRRVGLALDPAALKDLDALRAKLREAEETLSAIQSGAVDAVVVVDPAGARRVYTLKGADKPYRVLIESMNEGALTLSERGVVLYCNARMAAIAGRPLERMMGHPFSRLLANGDRAHFAKMLRGGRGPRKATVQLRLPGGVAPVQLSLTPLDLDGARAFGVIVTDLTEAFAVRQLLRQKDAGLRLVTEAAPAILFTADSRGRVLSAAGAALKTIHGRLNALLAAPVLGSRGRRTALSMRLRAVNVGRASYDASYADRLWNVSLERLGIGGVIGIAVDVTHERRERELSQSVVRERLQRDYVANVSHEFRTPLAAILGSVETLLGGGLEEKRSARSFVRVIGRQTAHLGELVENLLYQSAVESGHLTPQPCQIRLAGFMGELLKGLRLQASRRNVAIKVSIPRNIEVFADKGHLRRVLMNVVFNGLKYNRDGGELSVSALERDGQVKLSVADTGIGIKPSELPFIFDRFHRAKNARRLAIKGTGLGLSVAKVLIEGNKGRIWADSAPGKGTRLHIQLASRG